MGLSTFRIRGDAYSLRYMAAPSPRGTATISAITVTIRVPATSGRTAKSPSVAKKSPNGISWKKSMTGRMSAMTIPNEMAIDSSADSTSSALMTASPGRDFARRSTVAAGRPAPGGGPALASDALLIRLDRTLDQPAMPSSADWVSAYCSSLSGMNRAASAIVSRFSM